MFRISHWSETVQPFTNHRNICREVFCVFCLRSGHKKWNKWLPQQGNSKGFWEDAVFKYSYPSTNGSIAFLFHLDNQIFWYSFYENWMLGLKRSWDISLLFRNKFWISSVKSACWFFWTFPTFDLTTTLETLPELVSQLPQVAFFLTHLKLKPPAGDFLFGELSRWWYQASEMKSTILHLGMGWVTLW